MIWVIVAWSLLLVLNDVRLLRTRTTTLDITDIHDEAIRKGMHPLTFEIIHTAIQCTLNVITAFGDGFTVAALIHVAWCMS